ncbi:STAS domain-containing protein [Amycolatopsis sp. NPDC051071]|uniref:STAS domain-containing protein n=1 Tax=Amycolatopsis sp. NPDC051071 TaxID=3154637 RepID=UPI00342A0BF6
MTPDTTFQPDRVSTDPRGTLTVHRTRYPGDIEVLTVSGDLDLGTVRILEHQLWLETSPGLVLDLGGVMFLSTAGIGCLLRAAERARAERRRFALVASTHSVSRVLRRLGVDTALPLYPGLCDAVRELSQVG